MRSKIQENGRFLHKLCAGKQNKTKKPPYSVLSITDNPKLHIWFFFFILFFLIYLLGDQDADGKDREISKKILIFPSKTVGTAENPDYCQSHRIILYYE